MFLSTFDMFKIGIGPSSSHTMGPMIAAARFLDHLRNSSFPVAGLRASLHGSLAFTGKGHETDRAVILGLAGFEPDSYDRHHAAACLAQVANQKRINVVGLPPLSFDPDIDLHFDFERQLPGHANGMILFALDPQGDVIVERTYYSIGGGFVLTAEELGQPPIEDGLPVPYPFANAADLLRICATHGMTIPQVMRRNERALRSDQEIARGIDAIWDAMHRCIERGLSTEGELPGGLQVRRRAAAIHAKLLDERGLNVVAPHTVNDWISTYAMAVNEENASGGQIVTAPTNGAAGVVPATLRYYLDHVPGASISRIADYFLTAGAIGGIIKRNASISGAECGCQAEVGSAAAMASAGLCQLLGGTPAQVENAAEISLEHHLGMTCDPVRGLVQIPCIERNGLGAIKAVSAASLSMRGDGTHRVPLDSCIETMRRTGADMNEKYKETSLGGLAVCIPNC